MTPPESGEASVPLICLLEPTPYLHAFMRHPPVGFAAQWSPSGMPAFTAPFNLLMTLDDAVRQRIEALPGYKYWGRLLVWQTRFVGSTVTEYAPFPAHRPPPQLVAELLQCYAHEHSLLIVKDLADGSPLLDAAQHQAVGELVRSLEAAGFVMLDGNSLGWLPVDFASISEFIASLPPDHRSNLRRKLKVRVHLTEQILPAGAPEFQDEGFIDLIYSLYVNVYQQSEVHFDVLDRAFFRQLLQDAESTGLLFTYRRDQELIGWKLCYVHQGRLLDKYLGFRYPQSRQNNLFFVSWVHCLEYALQHRLSHYIAGWTDARVKRYLGARLARTRHAVYVRNPLLRWCFRRLSHLFETEPG